MTQKNKNYKHISTKIGITFTEIGKIGIVRKTLQNISNRCHDQGSYLKLLYHKKYVYLGYHPINPLINDSNKTQT